MQSFRRLEDIGIADAQRVMNEQGYLVVSTSRKVGDVLPMIFCGGLPNIPGPVIVIGVASVEEWHAQQDKLGIERDGFEGCSYAKVLAE